MEAIRAQRPETEPARTGVDGRAFAGAEAATVRPIAAVRRARASFYRRRGKRALDVVCGAALFAALLPLMAAVVIAVLVTSGWPVLYASERVGHAGRPFRMRKFRTMVRDADRLLATWREQRPDLAAAYGENFKLKDDPRVTTLGRFLRKTSLDELPQLWNVLRGEMSLVGPRPVPAVEHDEKYGGLSEVVLSVRPGMTGPWQVNGRSAVNYARRVRYDADYAASASLLLDLKMLALTLPAVLLTRGAE